MTATPFNPIDAYLARKVVRELESFARTIHPDDEYGGMVLDMSALQSKAQVLFAGEDPYSKLKKGVKDLRKACGPIKAFMPHHALIGERMPTWDYFLRSAKEGLEKVLQIAQHGRMPDWNFQAFKADMWAFSDAIHGAQLLDLGKQLKLLEPNCTFSLSFNPCRCLSPLCSNVSWMYQVFGSTGQELGADGTLEGAFREAAHSKYRWRAMHELTREEALVAIRVVPVSTTSDPTYPIGRRLVFRSSWDEDFLEGRSRACYDYLHRDEAADGCVTYRPSTPYSSWALQNKEMLIRMIDMMRSSNKELNPHQLAMFGLFMPGALGFLLVKDGADVDFEDEEMIAFAHLISVVNAISLGETVTEEVLASIPDAPFDLHEFYAQQQTTSSSTSGGARPGRS